MKQATIIIAAVLLVGAVSIPQSATGVSTIRCAPTLSSFPTWDKWPKQSSLPDPFLPPRYMTLDNVESSPDNFTQDIMNGKGPNRVKTREEWYQCQQPQLIQLVQEYLYGDYPDHSQETVEVLRYGRTMDIFVTAGGKTGSFKAQLNIPSSRKGPFPTMVFLASPNYGRENYYNSNGGFLLVEVIPEEISSESNRTGAFWDIYGGQDIGVTTAWAWGVHRVLDALDLAVLEADMGRAGVCGCRKAGKAALAAGLFDKRIGLTVPINSGVLGMTPYRYSNLSGESNDGFEHFPSTVGPSFATSKLGQFVEHPENLPFDAHTIAAAIAPRTLLINEGGESTSYSSKGAMTVTYPAAKAVYDFLGAGDQFLTVPRAGGFSCTSSTFIPIFSYIRSVWSHTTSGTTSQEDQAKARDANPSVGPPLSMAFPWATAVPKAP